jgi:hypothetical protein
LPGGFAALNGVHAASPDFPRHRIRDAHRRSCAMRSEPPLSTLVGTSERPLWGSPIERTHLTGMGGVWAVYTFSRLWSEAPYHIKPGVCIRSKDGDLAVCRDDSSERSDVHLMCHEHERTRSAQPISNAVA